MTAAAAATTAEERDVIQAEANAFAMRERVSAADPQRRILLELRYLLISLRILLKLILFWHACGPDSFLGMCSLKMF